MAAATDAALMDVRFILFLFLPFEFCDSDALLKTWSLAELTTLSNAIASWQRTRDSCFKTSTFRFQTLHFE
jgi:hypothetical protein